MRVLVGDDSGSRYQLAQDAPIPVPTPGTLLVRVHSVTLNPQGASKVDDGALESVSGACDFAGTVTQLGEGVTRFHVGDRVLVLATMDRTKGSAFAEFALAEQESTCRVPDAMEFTEAISIGTGLAAVGQLSHNNTGTVLVSGGATPAGILATQLLKMAGYTPIVACSPADNAACLENGAVACFDKDSQACGADIRVHTDNGLLYALDCIADDGTMRMCYEALGSGSGPSYYLGLAKPANSIAIKYTRRDVRADWTLVDGVRVLGGGLDDLPAALEEIKTGKTYDTRKVIVPLTA